STDEIKTRLSIQDAVLKRILSILSTEESIRLSARSTHKEAFDQILRIVSSVKGVPLRPLQKILNRLEELNVAPEEITDRLYIWADEYVNLREQWLQVNGATTAISAVKTEALALIENADFHGARRLFSTARSKLRIARLARSRQEAALLAT